MQNAFCSEDQMVKSDKLGPPKISKILALLLLNSNTSHIPFSQPVRPHSLIAADRWAYSKALYLMNSKTLAKIRERPITALLEF